MIDPELFDQAFRGRQAVWEEERKRSQDFTAFAVRVIGIFAAAVAGVAGVAFASALAVRNG